MMGADGHVCDLAAPTGFDPATFRSTADALQLSYGAKGLAVFTHCLAGVDTPIGARGGPVGA